MDCAVSLREPPVDARAHVMGVFDRCGEVSVVAQETCDVECCRRIEPPSGEVADIRWFDHDFRRVLRHYRTPARLRMISSEIGTPRSHRTTFFIRHSIWFCGCIQDACKRGSALKVAKQAPTQLRRCAHLQHAAAMCVWSTKGGASGMRPGVAWRLDLMSSMSWLTRIQWPGMASFSGIAN